MGRRRAELRFPACRALPARPPAWPAAPPRGPGPPRPVGRRAAWRPAEDRRPPRYAARRGPGAGLARRGPGPGVGVRALQPPRGAWCRKGARDGGRRRGSRGPRWRRSGRDGGGAVPSPGCGGDGVSRGTGPCRAAASPAGGVKRGCHMAKEPRGPCLSRPTSEAGDSLDSPRF